MCHALQTPNNQKHHFRPFSVKISASNCFKSPKISFLVILCHFFQILSHFAPFWTFLAHMRYCEKLYNMEKHHFIPFSVQISDSNRFKSPKTSFLGTLGTLGTWAIARFQPNPDFSQNRRLCHLKGLIGPQVLTQNRKKLMAQFGYNSEKVQSGHIGHMGYSPF